MTAADLVVKVKNLPPVSHTALKLVTLLEQPAVSNSEVVETLRCDNVLTARLLRACNSPYFGLADTVSSVEQAVLILGHQQILHIVLTLAFGSVMVVPMPGYMVEANELWRHSLVSATAAECVANEINILASEPSVAFTAGLLHDIGKLVLGQALTFDQQAEIQRQAESHQQTRQEAERLILGTDHAEVGAFLLQRWHVPEEIVEAVANHHHPVLEPEPKLSAIAHLANLLAHVAAAGDTAIPPTDVPSPEVLTALGMTPDQLTEMILPIRESLGKVEQLLTLR